MSGAIAMIGMVWLATMSGTSARSSIRTWTSTMASPSPKADPSAKPIAALRSVKSAAPRSRSSVVAPAASDDSELHGDVPGVRQLRVGREAKVSGGS